MARTCSISCPFCQQPVAVWTSGGVSCGACGRTFEVGVYAPPPERFLREDLPLPAGLSVSGNWIQVGHRAYPISDIVGTHFTRASRGTRTTAFVVVLLGTLVAAQQREWRLASAGLLVAVGLILWWRLHPQQYLVSWMTRGGREECASFPDRESALCWLAVIRPEGRMTLQEHSWHLLRGVIGRLRRWIQT
jgi:hypothetical protein